MLAPGGIPSLHEGGSGPVLCCRESRDVKHDYSKVHTLVSYDAPSHLRVSFRSWKACLNSSICQNSGGENYTHGYG